MMKISSSFIGIQSLMSSNIDGTKESRDKTRLIVRVLFFPPKTIKM
jgi:hypothetical protein